MTYEIRSYQDGYIDKQVRIGSEVMSTWKYQRQSNKDLIKQIYSSDDFDPETRLYAFHDGKMVGFLPAKIIEEEDQKIALYEFPIVLSEHEEEVGPLLIEESFAVLEKKGVDIIRARVSPHWGNTEKYAKQYGFEFYQDTMVTTDFDPEDLDQSDLEHHDAVVEIDYDNENHIDAFSESFVQRFPMRYEGEIDEWIDYYQGLDKVTQLLYFNEDRVEGHLLAVLRTGQEHKPVVTAFYAQGDNQGMKMKYLLEELLIKLQEGNYLQVSIALGTEQIPYVDKIEELGLEFNSQVSHYQKTI